MPLMRQVGAWFQAEMSVVEGDVRLAPGVNIWPGCVLRGDDAPIIIGENTNVQDGTVIHADPGVSVEIGSHVSIGHMAMVHGRAIGEGTLIGIGAIVLGGAVIGRQCIIAAGALVPENAVIPDFAVVMGVPGKVRRETTEPERQFSTMRALAYVEKAKLWAAGQYPSISPA